jgi:hypothetical protein
MEDVIVTRVKFQMFAELRKGRRAEEVNVGGKVVFLDQFH